MSYLGNNAPVLLDFYLSLPMQLNSLTTSHISSLSAFVTIFYEPVRTFERIEQHPKGWLPLLVLMTTTGALMAFFFLTVDFFWFQDQLLVTVNDTAAREQAREIMSKPLIATTTVAVTVASVPAACAMVAAYLMIASYFVNAQLGFSRAFSLSAWASVPNLMLLPLGVIQMLLWSNGQLTVSELNPLSVNQLFFQFEMTHPLAAVLDTLSVLTVWAALLSVLGFQTWAKVSRLTACKVVLPLYIVFFGGWLAYAMSHAS